MHHTTPPFYHSHQIYETDTCKQRPLHQGPVILQLHMQAVTCNTRWFCFALILTHFTDQNKPYYYAQACKRQYDIHMYQQCVTISCKMWNCHDLWCPMQPIGIRKNRWWIMDGLGLNKSAFWSDAWCHVQYSWASCTCEWVILLTC